jgi:hypothetical protein
MYSLEHGFFDRQELSVRNGSDHVEAYGFLVNGREAWPNTYRHPVAVRT